MAKKSQWVLNSVEDLSAVVDDALRKGKHAVPPPVGPLEQARLALAHGRLWCSSAFVEVLVPGLTREKLKSKSPPPTAYRDQKAVSDGEDLLTRSTSAVHYRLDELIALADKSWETWRARVKTDGAAEILKAMASRHRLDIMVAEAVKNGLPRENVNRLLDALGLSRIAPNFHAFVTADDPAMTWPCRRFRRQWPNIGGSAHDVVDIFEVLDCEDVFPLADGSIAPFVEPHIEWLSVSEWLAIRAGATTTAAGVPIRAYASSRGVAAKFDWDRK